MAMSSKKRTQDAAAFFSQEWKSFQGLYPQSTLRSKGSKSKESTVVVPLSVEDLYFVFYFRISANYPFQVPEIFLTSQTLSKSEINDILKELDVICSCCAGQPMLMSCVEEGMNLIQNLIAARHGGKSGGKPNNDQKPRKKTKKKEVCVKPEEKIEENFGGDLNDSDLKLPDDIAVAFEDEDFFATKNSESNSVIETKPKRPNYFISIRIWNEDLINNLILVQNALVEQEALLTKGIIPASSLHLTLCNLGLDHADDLLRAMESLRKMKLELQSVLPNSPLIIHGASQFYNRAIFAKMKMNKDFLTFRNMLIENLDKAGVEFRQDHEEYNPHVTLIKVRRPERKMFGHRPIRPQIYSSFLESIHGEQIIDAVYLCAMDGNKREDGFYNTHYELQFS